MNVAGGVRVEEPAVDLAIALAVASSFKEMPVDPRAVFLGEIGLSGEVRGCSQIDKRLREAGRLGFASALLATKNANGRDAKGHGLSIAGVDSLRAAVDRALIGDTGRPAGSEPEAKREARPPRARNDESESGESNESDDQSL